jgi:hypothetical protein
MITAIDVCVSQGIPIKIARQILMNVRQILVRTEAPALTEWMAMFVSVLILTQAATVRLNSKVSSCKQVKKYILLSLLKEYQKYW